MFGTLRLILAYMVLISHLNITLQGKNPGVVAVVIFYLLSGYMMTGLLRRRYPQFKNLGGFYLDRLWRIYPQYLFFSLLTLWLIHAQPIDSYFVSAPLDSLKILSNALIVPLNYYMFNGIDRSTLIPPAWSLGAELQFYLLVPCLLLLHKHLRACCLWGSFALTLLAFGGYLNSDWYAYRLLPGALYIFLSGSYCYDRQQQRANQTNTPLTPSERARAWKRYKATLFPLSPRERAGERGIQRRVITSPPKAFITFAPFSVMTAMLCYTAFQLATQQTWKHYDAEIICGYCLGIALITRLAQYPKKNWDDYLGHLSYGVFLAHFWVMWRLQSYEITLQNKNIALFSILLLTTSTLLAVFTYHAVERPLLALKRTILQQHPKPKGNKDFA